MSVRKNRDVTGTSFGDDVKQLRGLIEKNMLAGHGRQSLKMAKEQMKALQAASAGMPDRPKPKRHHGRTFLVSFLFGALWSRRR